MATKEIIFEKDVANKKIIVVREFDAPVTQVWKAWTESELLDQWWAPKPWKANTSSMDFRVGGYWLYYMEGPDGARHFARVDYKSIQPGQTFAADDYFTDDKGNRLQEMPGMHWVCEFSKSGQGTKVEVHITFSSDADMEKVIEMGFKDGFAMALKNLDELLAR